MTSKTGCASSAFQFQSGYQEGEGVSNLLKFGARYDDASLGRWTQQDPVAGSLGRWRWKANWLIQDCDEGKVLVA